MIARIVGLDAAREMREIREYSGWTFCQGAPAIGGALAVSPSPLRQLAHGDEQIEIDRGATFLRGES